MFSSSSNINPCLSLFFDRADHLRFNMAIISGPGSFAVQFGDHLRSGIICGPGSFAVLGPVSQKFRKLFGPVKPFLVRLYLEKEKC